MRGTNNVALMGEMGDWMTKWRRIITAANG